MTAETRRVLDAAISERSFHKQVVDLANMAGWSVWHDNATNAPRRCKRCDEPIPVIRNTPGFPDLIAIRGEDLYAIELKAQRGRLTADQMRWLHAFAGVKWVKALMVKPAGWDQLVEILTTPPRGGGRA